MLPEHIILFEFCFNIHYKAYVCQENSYVTCVMFLSLVLKAQWNTRGHFYCRPSLKLFLSILFILCLCIRYEYSLYKNKCVCVFEKGTHSTLYAGGIWLNEWVETCRKTWRVTDLKPVWTSYHEKRSRDKHKRTDKKCWLDAAMSFLKSCVQPNDINDINVS